MRAAQVGHVYTRRARGWNGTRAGVDHNAQLNTARQPDLQVHGVQPADAPGPKVPPPPAYTSPDHQARHRAWMEREAAIWMNGLTPMAIHKLELKVS